MGKQIHFLHLEEDAKRLLRKVESVHGIIALRDGRIVAEEEFCRLMCDAVCKLYILPKLLIGKRSDLLDQMLWQGNAIELMNCNRGTQRSRTYESGRLYFTANWTDGSYDEDVLRMYNTLSGFIRGHYTYSKSTGIYYSTGFKEKFGKQEIFATQLQRPIYNL